MARTEGIEGEGGGSHHFTEEELWREQKALREGGHITREGLVIHVYGGHARLFSLLDFEEGKYQVFQDSYLALRWKFLFQV